MTLHIICFGALNIDRLYRVDKIAGRGEERRILGVNEQPGGSAANTAVGLARLGLKVGFIGKVANDREGKILISDLEKEGIDVKGVKVSSSGRSGVVNGYVDQHGERALYVDPGVNDTLTLRDIDLSWVSSARFLHLTSFVGEKPFEAQIQLVERLPKNVRVSLDPGHLYAIKGLKRLEPIIRRCNILIPNEKELKLLTGKGPEEGAETLLSYGVSVVAVKLGHKGCYVTNGEEKHWLRTFKVKVVDTTGAGDAFCAGFLYGIIKDMSIKDSGILGNYIASRCITKSGARAGLPYISEINLAKIYELYGGSVG